MSVRKPAVTNLFYPANPAKLKEQLRNCFNNKKGPGLPSVKSEKRLVGGITPHAGYIYSGYAAAFTYKALAESKRPDTIIILGPSHTQPGLVANISDFSGWVTPLGIVKTDRELSAELGTFSFELSNTAHINEHAIEVQLPFLQFVFKNKVPKIVPIVVSMPLECELCKRFGEEIARVIRNSEKEVLILATSDFTHYGISYQYIPFVGKSSEIKNKLSKLDRGAIAKIEAMDERGFINYIKQTGATVCGAVPIAIQLFALNALNGCGGQLLTYYTSGDITNDFSSSVSYASIVFE